MGRSLHNHKVPIAPKPSGILDLARRSAGARGEVARIVSAALEAHAEEVVFTEDDERYFYWFGIPAGRSQPTYLPTSRFDEIDTLLMDLAGYVHDGVEIDRTVSGTFKLARGTKRSLVRYDRRTNRRGFNAVLRLTRE